MPRRSRIVTLFVLALTAFPAPSAAAAPGEQAWASTYDGGVTNGFDLAHAIAASADGARVYVTGESDAANGHRDYATVSYAAATGAQAWAVRYDNGSDDIASSIAVSPDRSRIFVTGTSNVDLGGANADYATVAYDSTGHEVWVKRAGGLARDDAVALAVSPDGSRVFVTGTSNSATTARDYLTIAYNAATGARLWTRRYDNAAMQIGVGDQAASLVVSPDGTRLYVTGGSESPTTSFDYATVAYNAASGAQIWVRRYDGPTHQSDRASALALNGAGTRIYVTGESDHLDNSCIGCTMDYATVGYRADTGKVLWTRRFGRASADDRARAIDVSPRGFVVVTGESRHQHGYDYATVAYRTGTGAAVWSRRYDFAGRFDVANAIAVSPGGAHVYVTGESDRATGLPDAATLAYGTSTGASEWVSRLDSGSADRGQALMVAPDGKHVFVAGQTVGPPGFEFVTVSYAR